MKQIEFKLERIVHDDKGEEQLFKYYYEPVSPVMEKKLEIQVHAKDPFSMTSNLGFPAEIGDTVLLQIGAKKTQSKLSDSPKEHD